MASCSTSSNAVTRSDLSMDYMSYYPHPLATYEQVIESPKRFRQTLVLLHASMGTKFWVPTVDGQVLDLYRLFAEVTSRGGIMKVRTERRLKKEVFNVLDFRPTATHAPRCLGDHYTRLLSHYEQAYFFRVNGWWLQQNSSIWLPGSVVHGVIDGKSEEGYLITVKINGEEHKGVLYELTHQQKPDEVIQPERRVRRSSEVVCRKRRKKLEIRRRDHDNPKANKSGYIFGKHGDISKMLGDAWSCLNETVCQEQDTRDEEIKREEHRQRLQGAPNTTNTVPIQQQPIQMASQPSTSQAMKLDAIDAVPVHEEGVRSDVNMTNLDITVQYLFESPKNSQPLEDNITMEMPPNVGDVEMTDQVQRPTHEEDADHAAAGNNGDNSDS